MEGNLKADALFNEQNMHSQVVAPTTTLCTGGTRALTTPTSISLCSVSPFQSHKQAASLSGVSDPVEKGKPTASVSPNQIERESRFERRIRRGIAQPCTEKRSDVPSAKRPCTEKRKTKRSVSPDREPRAPYELLCEQNKAANLVILKNLGIDTLVKAMR